MKEISELHPTDRKRLYDDLRRDPSFLKSRNLLLLVTVGSAIFLAFVSFLMLRGMFSEDAMFVAMAISAIVYLYTVSRFVRTRKAVLSRLMAVGDEKRLAKAEKKAEKKAAKKLARRGPQE